VAAVIDGDTVRLDDGKEVRLAAIVAPRARDAGAAAGEWPPEAAARASLSALVLGRTVALAFPERRDDRYGRVVAHLYVGGQEGRAWVQQHLVETGQVRVHPVPGQSDCIDDLLARERVARSASRGLWSEAAYQIRPADRPTELARYAGTLQLVSGRVEKVSALQSIFILDLADAEPVRPGQAQSTRSGARVTWRRSAAVLPGAADPRSFQQRDVLVRGWVTARGNRPEIELIAAGQIELLDGSPAGPAPPAATDSSVRGRKRHRPATEPPGDRN
jgi:micrococcal nuclease